MSIQSLLNDSTSTIDTITTPSDSDNAKSVRIAPSSKTIKKSSKSNARLVDDVPADRRKKNNDAVRRFRERTKRKKLELKEAYEQNEQRIEHLNSLIVKLSDELAGRTENQSERINIDAPITDRSSTRNKGKKYESLLSQSHPHPPPIDLPADSLRST